MIACVENRKKVQKNNWPWGKSSLPVNLLFA
jgi:hypothetical protein